jgi:hypothetical protein
MATAKTKMGIAQNTPKTGKIPVICTIVLATTIEKAQRRWYL